VLHWNSPQLDQRNWRSNEEGEGDEDGSVDEFEEYGDQVNEDNPEKYEDDNHIRNEPEFDWKYGPR